ncbi:unnamed protein product, partial [Ascophyllum nodosum]
LFTVVVDIVPPSPRERDMPMKSEIRCIGRRFCAMIPKSDEEQRTSTTPCAQA